MVAVGVAPHLVFWIVLTQLLCCLLQDEDGAEQEIFLATAGQRASNPHDQPETLRMVLLLQRQMLQAGQTVGWAPYPKCACAFKHVLTPITIDGRFGQCKM